MSHASQMSDDQMREDRDEDCRRDAIDERRRRIALHCRCDPKGTMPGHCPGVAVCPYSGFNDGEDEDQ